MRLRFCTVQPPGTNSLLDLIVFGKHAGLKAAEYSRAPASRACRMIRPISPRQPDAIRNAQGKENIIEIANTMKATMTDKVGMFRTGEGMQQALDTVRELRQRHKNIPLVDRGKIFNTQLINIWELGNLLHVAELVTVCALNRTESRGAHARDDFPKRDDANWLKHTLSWVRVDGNIDLGYKPVVITKYQPKERVY
jgi:succinate dehydrogenase / fumarate reductase flavoprotein subunit